MCKLRISALILALVLMFSLLCACGETPEDPKPVKSGAEEQTDRYDFNNEDFHFVGAFIPKAWRDYSDEEKEKAGGKAPILKSTNQAMADKALDTEKKLNCRIICEALPADNSTDIVTMLAAGEAQADIIYQDSNMLRDLYIAGLMADLRDVKAVDLTDSAKWGSETNLKLTQYKGAQFGIPEIGSRYYPFESFFYGILLQKNSAFEAFETDWTVYELVDSHEWTFDKFLEIMPEVATGYDTEDYVRYALVFNSGATVYYSALYVNEGSPVIYNEETGRYEYGMLTDNAIEAIEFSRSVFMMDEYFNRGGTSSINDFCGNMYTFFLTVGYRAFNEIANSTTDITWIPFPYGPHSEYGVSTAAYNQSNFDCVVGVFVGGVNDADPAAETQKNGVVFNELFGPTEAFGTDGYDEWLSHNVFPKDDNRSWAMYDQMRNNIHLSYHDDLGADLYNQIGNKIQSCLLSESRSIVNTMKTLEDAVNQKLDAELNN